MSCPDPRTAAMRRKRASQSFLTVVGMAGGAFALFLLLRPLMTLNPFLFFGAVALIGCILGALLLSALLAGHRRALGALRASEQHHRMTLASLGDAVLTTDAGGRVTFLNAAAEALTGWPAEAASGQASTTVLRLVSDGTRYPVDRLVELVIHGGEGMRLVGQVVLIARDGAERPVEYRGAPIQADDGTVLGAALILYDISARKQIEDQLQRQTVSDGVTGLANRTLFLSSVQQALARARRRPDYGFAVLMLDLDRFKTVNDSLGPQAGDQLLAATGHRISACVRSTDTVARLSGDEFAILLDDCTESSAGRSRRRPHPAAADGAAGDQRARAGRDSDYRDHNEQHRLRPAGGHAA